MANDSDFTSESGKYLVWVESPEFELFFEEGSADVCGVMQFSGSVVVEYLSENPRVPVEEVLVEHGVVVGQRLCQPGEPGGWDLLEGGLVRLVPDAADV